MGLDAFDVLVDGFLFFGEGEDYEGERGKLVGGVRVLKGGGIYRRC